MRHHILIPTDFSDNAWSAALYALKLYADVPCTFYFSHAWTFLNTGSRTCISPSYIDPIKDASKKQLTEVKNRAKKESTNPEHDFKSIYSEGSLTDSIQIAFKKHKINLIVMGTKGATGAKKLILGSNTVTVINKIRKCPLMLIPNNFEYITPKQIVFPTDFNRFYGEELTHIKQLSDLHNSTIEILHINGKDDLSETQSSNVEMLKTYLEDYPHTFNWMPNQPKKADAITNFVKEHNIDILTMINYEHSFIENMINEPVIKKMGFKSSIPFMVIPRKE